MSRYLLSEVTNAKVYSSQGIFATLDTVTIAIYKNGVLEPLDSNACVEIGTTGNFYFDLSNITTQPIAYAELYWVMSDTTTKKESGLIVAGGWVESVPQALTPANMCRVTTNLSRIDGSCSSEPGTVTRDNNGNTIDLEASYTDGARYFELGKYKPSYDELTSATYWLVPRLAIVNINIQAYGVSKKNVEIPDQETITIEALLAL